MEVEPSKPETMQPVTHELRVAAQQTIAGIAKNSKGRIHSARGIANCLQPAKASRRWHCNSLARITKPDL